MTRGASGLARRLDEHAEPAGRGSSYGQSGIRRMVAIVTYLMSGGWLTA